jgi:hypothetical protein
MLEHLLPYKEVFTVFINSNYGSELLKDTHWYIAEHMFKFLRIFYESTVILSGVYYPTAPLILHQLIDIAEHLKQAEKDDNFKHVARPMKMKFLKSWDEIPMFYSFATILDPRSKMKGFKCTLDLLGNAFGSDYSLCYGDVKDELTRLFSKYQEKYGSSACTTRAQRLGVPLVGSGNRWGRIFDRSSSSTPSTGAVNELTAYLDSDPVPWGDPNFDILLWWREHKQSYPILSIMACGIMVVPVSTVSPESCFSLTGRILEERRRRLFPEHVEMLTCIKDWDQAKRKAQHTVEDTELVQLFKTLKVGDAIPEDEDPATVNGNGSGEVRLASPSLAAPAPAAGEEATAGEVVAAAEEEVARDLKVSFKL